MNVIIIDYNSGNISSVTNSFKEVAKKKVNIEVTSDLNKIKSCDKIVLPGQGSFKSCVDALNNINGLVDTLNEFAIINKRKPILIETKKKVNNKNYSYKNDITIEEKYRKLIPSAQAVGELAYTNHKEWIVNKPYDLVPNYISPFEI